MEIHATRLPWGIRAIEVDIAGYAASSSAETALGQTHLEACGRNECDLRGDRVPDLLGGFEALSRAEALAASAEAVEGWRPSVLTLQTRPLGYVFDVALRGVIAVPQPRLAAAMARGTTPEVWEELRPYAERDEFHGIDLPIGRIVFRRAREEGAYEEHLLQKVPPLSKVQNR